MGDTFCGPKVGQVVLRAPPGGSPAFLATQVNASLTRNNDLPYVFGVRRFCHGPGIAPSSAYGSTERGQGPRVSAESLSAMEITLLCWVLRA